ncbi:hypothetical protein NEICINOT_04000 [Neisseria cinerea ATCC 14685]|uniref:Uncharacterized protein n=1 Tax=Neisseria cinerea ATCC 14685 TaxID=546262 RepID=D0W2W5_NEICI|nr:hypothetical protein NEICINOT_04000 [Neisseria cinerea ATCC 14685]
MQGKSASWLAYRICQRMPISLAYRIKLIISEPTFEVKETTPASRREKSS